MGNHLFKDSYCCPKASNLIDKYQYNKLLNDNGSFTVIGRLIKDKGLEEILKWVSRKR